MNRAILLINASSGHRQSPTLRLTEERFTAIRATLAGPCAVLPRHCPRGGLVITAWRADVPALNDVSDMSIPRYAAQQTPVRERELDDRRRLLDITYY